MAGINETTSVDPRREICFVTNCANLRYDVTDGANLPPGPQLDLLELTAGIVAAYVSNNRIQPGELGSLILSVRASLGALGQPQQKDEPAADKPSPAQIRKSITPDALISFIDGKPYKTLKRHLSCHGLDLAAYRARYGLPKDYPSTAPNYSATRAELARTLGLSTYARQARRTVEADPTLATEDAPKRRGRPKKLSA